MANYRGNHYFPKSMLFWYTGANKIDFYIFNQNKNKCLCLHKDIRTKNDYSNIAEINNLYRMSSGVSLETVMTHCENKMMWPFLNKSQGLILNNFNFMDDDIYLLELSWYVALMMQRNADRVGFYKQFDVLKKIGIKTAGLSLGDLYYESIKRSFNNNLIIKLIYHFLLKCSCRVHVINSERFCVKSNPITICHDGFFDKHITNFNDLKLAWPRLINLNAMHLGWESFDASLILPINKDIVLEFYISEDRRTQYVMENDKSIWLEQYFVLSIINSTEYLITSENLYLKSMNQKQKHLYIEQSLRAGYNWRIAGKTTKIDFFDENGESLTKDLF